jgi:sugar-specific transcriptional regulator TrmB
MKIDPEDTAVSPQWTHENIKDSETRNLMAELSGYGLTVNQARLYLFLLGKSPLSANEISVGLGLHRVEVYRKLHEMGALGLVEKHLDSPMKFSVLGPDSAVAGLITRIEQRVSALRVSSASLRNNLKGLQDSRRTEGKPVTRDHEYRFRSAVGREQYLNETKRLIDGARHEIMSVTSANGIMRGVLAGNLQDFKAAARRGVRTRMITEINSQNSVQAQKFSNIVELRHAHSVHFRFHIFDRTVTVLSTRFDDNVAIKSEQDDYFVFKDHAYAAAQSFLFEHLWETGMPFRDRLRQIG